jgi:threonine synthase
LLLGCHIGFSELMRAGIIASPPRLVAVQARACAPLAQAFDQGLDHIPSLDKQATVAEGIAVAEPARGMQIVHAVRQTGGCFVTVDDQEVVTWLHAMWRQGYYIEPTSAATIAGVAKYVEAHTGEEEIVSVFTGHGLKAGGKAVPH